MKFKFLNFMQIMSVCVALQASTAHAESANVHFNLDMNKTRPPNFFDVVENKNQKLCQAVTRQINESYTPDEQAADDILRRNFLDYFTNNSLTVYPSLYKGTGEFIPIEDDNVFVLPFSDTDGEHWVYEGFFSLYDSGAPQILISSKKLPENMQSFELNNSIMGDSSTRVYIDRKVSVSNFRYEKIKAPAVSFMKLADHTILFAGEIMPREVCTSKYNVYAYDLNDESDKPVCSFSSKLVISCSNKSIHHKHSAP